jgi:4'-phosphopantetheinyl transferase
MTLATLTNGDRSQMLGRICTTARLAPNGDSRLLYLSLMHPWNEHNVIHLISSRITADPRFLDQLWPLLSSDEQLRAYRFRSLKSRSTFIVARGLLRAILGQCLGIASPAISFCYGAHGKPSIENWQGIRFNIAHSEDFIVCALGADRELGVDIEYIQPMKDMERVAEQFFCTAEYQQLRAVPEKLRTKAFFDCWTRKEAFVKAVGDGLSYPLNMFQVTLQPGQRPEILNIAGHRASDLDWGLYDVTPSEDYAAALAVEKRNCHVRIWTFENPVDCFAFCRPNS